MDSVVAHQVVKKKNTRSPVWDYFGLKADENGDPIPELMHSPVCKQCGKNVAASRGNTTNLFSHLRDNHKELYNEIAPSCPSTAKQLGGSSSPRRAAPYHPIQLVNTSLVTKYAPESLEAQEINHAVAYYLAKDLQPCSTVEKSGFRHLVQKLNARYQLPSKEYFADVEVPRLYYHAKDHIVRPKLVEAQYFAVTTDMWTTPATGPYMSFSVHFIDREWSLESFCLDTNPLYEDHTGLNIAGTFKDVLANWELPLDKLIAATTDNKSNYISAFANHLGWIHISCFGHNLDLAIERALQVDKVQHSIRKCRSLVEAFSRSWQLSSELRQKQQQLGLPEQSLVADTAERWVSTYNMVSRAADQHQALSVLLVGDPKNSYSFHAPSDGEFSHLKTVATVLKPFSDLTEALSGERQVTASAIRPVLKHIFNNILVQVEGESDLAREMKVAIAADLQQRYNSPNVARVLDVCSFLDPRFKDQYLDDKDGTLSAVKGDCLAVLGTKGEEDVSSQSPAKRSKGLGAILTGFASESFCPETLLSPLDRVEKEIATYLEHQCIDADADPLAWWKAEHARLPTLAEAARKYLCICATSVPSERVISRGGYIANDYQSHLLPEEINRMVFLARNLS